jgi:hypothetical protein
MWKRNVLLLIPAFALVAGTAIAAGPSAGGASSVSTQTQPKKGTCTTQTKYRLNGQIKSQSTTCTDAKTSN